MTPPRFGTMRVHLFHNPDAGGGNLPTHDLVAAFRGAGHEVTCDTGAKEFDPDRAARAEVVVAAGGDGTVARVAQVLARMPEGRCPRLAVIPLGGCNNVATSLGLSGSPEAVAQGLGRAEERAFDLGVAEGPWGRKTFVEGLGLGPVARLISEGKARHMEQDERDRFAREAPLAFAVEATPHRWHASVDGEPLPAELLLLEVLAIPLSWRRFRLVPGGTTGDGLLDVAFLRPERRSEFLGWLGGDRSLPAAGVETVRGAAVRLIWDGSPLRLDDEGLPPPGGPAPVEARTGRTIRVLVPRLAEGEPPEPDRNARSMRSATPAHTPPKSG